MVAELLSSSDPQPFSRANPGSEVPLLVLCDHASNRVPEALGTLGVADHHLEAHIAWDIGAHNVAQRIVEQTGARGVFSGFSRLVIDCNRPLRNSTLVPEISDGIEITANRNLSREDLGKRLEEIYLPYHFAIVETLSEFAAKDIEPFVLSVHSCTPVVNGLARPWAIGIAHSPDERGSRPLLNALRQTDDFEVGDNEPYTVDHDDYTIYVHALDRGLKHALIEIRQDLIADDEGARLWGDRLCHVLSDLSWI